ncbi:MAG: amino acid ABC transporter permease [Micromonosporaceae bacterium]
MKSSPAHSPPSGSDPVVLTASGRRLGPRQRQRLTLGIQYAIFVLLVGLVIFGADWATITKEFLNQDVAGKMFPRIIVVGLFNTVVYTLLAFIFGFVVGLIMALMRLSKVTPYRWFATAYIELFRGLPALLVLFLVGYGIPTAFPDREIPGGVYGQVTIGLGLVASAYMAETFRAGIQAVPKGQVEAARTLGMSHARAMISIVLPQAIRIVIPPLTNEIILLTKDTSLVYVLGTTVTTQELTGMGREQLNTLVNATPLVVAGLMYLVITLPLSQVVRRLEVRAAKGTR